MLRSSSPADPANSTGTDLTWARLLRNPARSDSPLNPTRIPTTRRRSPTGRYLWKYQTFAGPGDTDESYDAADFQNMFLALQTVTPRARGRVVQGRCNPITYESTHRRSATIHRPIHQHERFPPARPGRPADAVVPPARPGQLLVPSADRDSIVATEAYRETTRSAPSCSPTAPTAFATRRRAADDPTSVSVAVRDQIVAHEAEDQPAAAARGPSQFRRQQSAVAAGRSRRHVARWSRNGNIAIPFWEAVGPWDVDNDNDGVPDSVWVDLGDPVQQAEDGTLYKPLYAFLIVDLDSRLNVNAHGLVGRSASPLLDPTIDPATGVGPGNLVADSSRAASKPPNYFSPGLGYGPAEISLRPLASRQIFPATSF